MPTMKDMASIKKGEYDSEAPPSETPQEKPTVKHVNQEGAEIKNEPMDDMLMNNMGMEDADEESGTELQIDSASLPAIKSWNVGKVYPVKLTMTGMELGDDGKTIIGKFKVK